MTAHTFPHRPWVWLLRKIEFIFCFFRLFVWQFPHNVLSQFDYDLRDAAWRKIVIFQLWQLIFFGQYQCKLNSYSGFAKCFITFTNTLRRNFMDIYLLFKFTLIEISHFTSLKLTFFLIFKILLLKFFNLLQRTCQGYTAFLLISSQ